MTITPMEVPRRAAPPETLDERAVQEDFATAAMKSDEVGRAEPKREKLDPDKDYSWRRFYVRPKWKDFEPGEGLANRLDGAPPPKPRRFRNVTPGDMVATLVREAHARGSLDEIKLGFTKEKDSAGHRWSRKKRDLVSHKFEPGATVLDVVRWLDDENIAEARMDGRKLLLYPAGWGHNRTSKVQLAKGKNLTDGPAKGSAKDVVTDAYVLSESGVHGWVHDKGARRRWGRRIEAVHQINSVRTWDQAEARGERVLSRSGLEREQQTFGVVPDRGADPYKNFDIGDYVLVMKDGVPKKQRVRQIGLSWQGGDETVAIALTLGHKMYPLAAKQARRNRSHDGKAISTTNGSRIATFGPDRVEPDGYAPYAPSRPQIATKAGTMQVTWDGLDETGATPVWDQARVEIHVSEEEDFEPGDATYMSALSGPGSLTVNDLEYGVPQYFKLVAVDEGGDRSAPSEEAVSSLATVSGDDIEPGAVGLEQISSDVPLGGGVVEPVQPTEAPPAPTVTGMKAAIAVRWDGIVNETSVEYQVHMSTDSGFVPVFDDPATKLGPNTAGNFVVANRQPNGEEMDYYQPDDVTEQLYYFSIIPFNDAGPGPASAVAGASMDKTAMGDLIADAVLTQLLESLNIRGQELVIGSDVGRSIILNVTEGLVIRSQSGQPLLAAPTDDNSELSIKAKAVLTTLDVTSGMTVFGPNNAFAGNSVTRLKNGVADPLQRPTSALDLQKKQFEKPSGAGDFYGLAWNASAGRYYSCWIPDNGTPQMITFDTDGAILFAFNLSSTWKPKGGCAYDPVNGRLVLLVTKDDYAYIYEVRNLDGSLHNRNTQDVETYGYYSPSYRPVIGRDHAHANRILRAHYSTTSSRILVYGDVPLADGTFNHDFGGYYTGTNGSNPSAELKNHGGCILRIPNLAGFDLGAERFIWHGRENTNSLFSAWDPNSNAADMTRDVNREWLTDGGWVAGTIWNTTTQRFETITGQGMHKTWEGNGNKWVGAAQETWLASVTNYDSNPAGAAPGTHESKPSPALSFTMNKRWRLSIIGTTPPFYGGVDDADKVRLYLAKSVPNLPTTRLQAASSDGQFTITNATFTTASAPTLNNFPATAPSKIIADDLLDDEGLPLIDLRGSGYSKLWQLLLRSDAEASTAAGNKPAMRTGKTSGKHLRYGTDRIIAMNSDSQAGVLDLSQMPVKIGGKTITKIAWQAFGTVTTNSTGDATIAHGMGLTPDLVLGFPSSHYAQAWIPMWDQSNTDSNNIRFKLRNTNDQSNVASVTRTVTWLAIG